MKIEGVDAFSLLGINDRHLQQHPGDTELSARIASYELAARMQLTVPEVADLSSEPAHILKLYGADEGGTKTKDLRAARDALRQ